MMWRSLRLAAVRTAIVLSAPVVAEEITAGQGQLLYENRCMSCHGRHGELKALGRSKPLVDLTEAEVLAKLQAVRQLSAPRTMQDRIKSGLSDDEAREIAAYIGTFGG